MSKLGNVIKPSRTRTRLDNPAGAGGPQTMRLWVIDVNGTLIGAGWYNNGAG